MPSAILTPVPSTKPIHALTRLVRARQLAVQRGLAEHGAEERPEDEPRQPEEEAEQGAERRATTARGLAPRRLAPAAAATRSMA